MEMVILTNFHVGVSIENGSLLVNGEWIDSTAAQRYADDRFNYKGWDKPGKLYCHKCWSQLLGRPKEIIIRNWCDFCKAKLYPDDEKWFDQTGFFLYRDQATRYMGLAIRKYWKLIDRCEHLCENGRMEEGYHKDHIYSVRDAFENNVPDIVVSSPLNVSIVKSEKNLSKGRNSHCSLDELYAKYGEFLHDYPEWPEITRNFYEQQWDGVLSPKNA